MIAIVISEKGGAERREKYDRTEVTIGRVKGNDVLLPKGNVSKRHARLIVRDGRYIVTDLKSTNGTYVNHRRITHATLVREGDRIYIGDFVLRIEGDSSESSSKFDSSERRVYDSPDSSTSGGSTSYAMTGSSGAMTAPPDEVVSHFPIEHDPDESSPALDVPGPPRVPTGFKPSSTGSMPANSEPLTSDAPSPRGSAPRLSMGSSEPQRSGESLEREEQRQTAYDHLIAAVEENIGVEPLRVAEPDDDLAKAVDEAINTALAELGDLPEGLDEETLRGAARQELLELGPMTSLLADEHSNRISVVSRRVAAQRRGRRVQHGGLHFGSEAGVERALLRLAATAETELGDGWLEVDLPGGRQLTAARPGTSLDTHILTIRSAHRERSSLDGLVRSGAISRGMATLLSHCVAARSNILVTGAHDSGAVEVAEALARAIPRSQQGLWLGREDFAAPEGVAAMRLGEDGPARELTEVTKLGLDHLVVPALGGDGLLGLLDAVMGGLEGVTYVAAAATLRQAVSRLSADVAAARPGLTPPTAREWLGSSFDVGLEVARLRDGRLRVVRLAELRDSASGVSLRDVFTFAYHRTAAGGSIEGAFYASGTVPRFVEELASRGMPLDTSIFRRHPSS